MAVKNMTSQKKNRAEVRVRRILAGTDIKFIDIAEHLGVSQPAISMRLKRGSVEPILDAIKEIQEQDSPKKVAS